MYVCTVHEKDHLHHVDRTLFMLSNDVRRVSATSLTKTDQHSDARTTMASASSISFRVEQIPYFAWLENGRQGGRG